MEYLARFQVANRYRDYIYVYRYLELYGCWCYSVAKLCLTLHHMDCSMPGFAVLHYLEACPNSCPSSWWCYLTMSSSTAYFFCLQSFPASGSFPMRCLIALGGQSIGASSVLPMNTQDWSPLGWTGWISLLSKGLSRVFSNTTVQKLQFFGAQLSL